MGSARYTLSSGSTVNASEPFDVGGGDLGRCRDRRRIHDRRDIGRVWQTDDVSKLVHDDLFELRIGVVDRQQYRTGVDLVCRRIDSELSVRMLDGVANHLDRNNSRRWFIERLDIFGIAGKYEHPPADIDAGIGY